MKKYFKEAILSNNVQKLLSYTTDKDWYRAATVTPNRIDSMFSKITDPDKKLGRVVALFVFNRIDERKAEQYLSDNFDSTAFSSKNNRQKGIEQNFANNYISRKFDYDSADDQTIEDFLNTNFPEYDPEILEPTDFVVESLDELTEEELKQCQSLNKALEKYPEVAESFQKIIKNNDWQSYTKSWYDDEKNRFNSKKDTIRKYYTAKNTFGDDKIFDYILDADKLADEYAEYNNRSLENVLELIEIRCQNDNCLAQDSEFISPTSLLNLMEYKTNFVEWLKQNYNINVKAPRYWNAYHRSAVFKFLDDNSAFEALSLRKDPKLSQLFTITRDGIAFTRIGSNKYWYDCTVDIANHFDFDYKIQKPY